MADRVDKAGLTYFYNKIKNKFQNKLVAGSNVSISGDTISATDTTYSNATSSAAGLMSATDKSKLDGVSGNWLDGSSTGSVRTNGSKAEDSNYTIGQYATAEGYNTKASGKYSYAEGKDTTASNTYSHAEGYGTIASGQGAHAEGQSTTSSGLETHTEGFNTTASGNRSHAEGEGTIASGYYSHASGYYTTAQRRSQTVIGEYNERDTEGSGVSKYGKYAFIIGNGDYDETIVGERYYSNALTVDWDGNLETSGDVNVASGKHFKINGTNLSASDVGAQPTLVSGTNIKTINNQSLLGSGNISISGGSGAANWLDGSQTGSVRTSGSSSEGAGYTIGQYATAEGYGTEAGGDYAHAEGEETSAYGYASHAEGGCLNNAGGDYSHAEGYYNIAVGNASHVEGSESGAAGDSSHAEGYNTASDGDNSHAEGYNTQASGKNSHVEGEGTHAVGENSHTGGYYTTAFGDGQYVIGRYNLPDETAFVKNTWEGIDSEETYYTKNNNGTFELVSYPRVEDALTYYIGRPGSAEKAFIIGNGDFNNNNPSNALTVDWNGNVNIPAGASYKVNGTPIGTTYTAGTGISIINGVISLDLSNAESQEF